MAAPHNSARTFGWRFCGGKRYFSAGILGVFQEKIPPFQRKRSAEGRRRNCAVLPYVIPSVVEGSTHSTDVCSQRSAKIPRLRFAALGMTGGGCVPSRRRWCKDGVQAAFSGPACAVPPSRSGKAGALARRKDAHISYLTSHISYLLTSRPSALT